MNERRTAKRSIFPTRYIYIVMMRREFNENVGKEE
jgi:hypothetical protein